MASDTRLTRLRVVRLALGLTQDQLAVKAGISQSAVSRIERGGWADPVERAALARAVGLSGAHLLRRVEPPRRPLSEVTEGTTEGLKAPA